MPQILSCSISAQAEEMFRQFLFLNSAQTAQPEEREIERRVFDLLLWFKSVDENEAGRWV